MNSATQSEFTSGLGKTHSHHYNNPKNITSVLDDFEKQKKTEIREVFDLFDDAKTGFILGENMKICLKTLGIKIKKKEIAVLLKEMFDKELKDKFKFEDFYKIAKKKLDERDPVQEMKESFNFLCNYEDSEDKEPPEIDSQFLKGVAESVGETLSPEEIEEMIQIVGGQKMKITRDDFIAFMNNPLNYEAVN